MFAAAAVSAASGAGFAVVHSIEGYFLRSQTRVNGIPAIELRLGNGGHGQKGMDLLDKYGIEYHIVKTYSNGARVGYVPNHKKTYKQSGIGQAWFAKSWTVKDIKHAGEHVAGFLFSKQNVFTELSSS